MTRRLPRSACRHLPSTLAALLALGAAGSGCAATSTGPSQDLRLSRVVLYQNGIGYFERTGVLEEEKLRLQFRDHEVDDVLKSLVVVEEGASDGKHKPATVSVLLPEAKERKTDAEGTTWLDLVLSRNLGRPISIAYAVPTAAWKATYRVILPDPAAKGAAGQRALLQAWALVDNVTDEDWNGVRLTLATGAPLSFATSIRAPKFVPRPDGAGNMVEPVATAPVYAERTRGPDRDGDGIVDSTDKCPDNPSPGDGDDGCPETVNGDSDKDGIADARDACPREPGAASPDPSRNGCPAAHRIVVTSSDIRILQQIVFEKGSAVLRKESEPILDAVAETLRSSPQIKRMAVEGHADDDEKDGWNLSAQRAAAIRAALEKRGVTTELVTRAFGPTRPLESGKDDKARAKNRRAEFRIEGTTTTGTQGAGRESSRTALLKDSILAGSVEASNKAAAAPHDVAGAVRYDVDDPISIPHRSSTLVTLINDYLPGADVYLYRPDPAVPTTATYPLRAARLENRGAHGLQAGSVSIFAGGTFVGEGLIEHLSPGETAMIPYALDSSTSVRPTTESATKPVRLVALARGVMTVENVEVLTTRYEIAVGKQAPGVMFLRHPRHEGFEAKDLPPGTETTASAHLVRVPLTPGKTSVVTVEERRPRRAEITVLDGAGKELGLYLSAVSPGAVPSEVDAAVREVVALRVELGKLEEDTAALREQISDVAQRAAELRASLHAVEKTPRAGELQKKLLERLTAATAQGEALAAKLAERSANQTELRTRLTEMLREVKLEDKTEKKAK